MIRAATCFSGIGAPEIAMPGWDWLWHAEIEPFPSAVMAARHPASTNLGDVLAPDFIERALAFGPLDVLAGGPPCQGFSIAGLRGGMSDPRGNLTLRWAQILHAIKPRNAITENVPGWLSMPDNAFGCYLAALVGADDALRSPLDGGRWPGVGMASGPLGRLAWATLDAQWFNVAQRRRRVFVVADFGDGADPAEILFNSPRLLGNPPSRGETRERVAPTISARTKGGGGLGTDFDLDGGLIHCADIAPTLNSHFGDKQGLEDQHINGGGACSLPAVSMCLNAGAMGRCDAETETLIPTNRCVFDDAPCIPEISPTLQADSNMTGGERPPGTTVDTCESLIAFPEFMSATQHASTENLSPSLGAINPTALAYGMSTQQEPKWMEDLSPTLALPSKSGGGQVTAVAFSIMPMNSGKDFKARETDVAQPIMAGGPVGGNQGGDYVTQNWHVRRLTVTECERLQGFPKVQKSYLLIGSGNCFGPQNDCAPVALKCLKSPSNVWNADAQGWTLSASAAENHSNTNHHAQDWPVALDVLIDLGRSAVLISSREKSAFPAATAVHLNEFPLPIGIGNFVRLVALTTQIWGRTMQLGKVESQPNTTPFTVQPNGKNTVAQFGPETGGNADGVASAIRMANDFSTSTTSEFGPDTPNFAWMLQTLSSCVAHAICGFIPKQILEASCFAVRITTVEDYTAIQYRGKIAADGPRYKALGNSWAVPCGRWIMARIEAGMPAIERMSA